MLISFIDHKDPGALARSMFNDKNTPSELAKVLRKALLELL